MYHLLEYLISFGLGYALCWSKTKSVTEFHGLRGKINDISVPSFHLVDGVHVTACRGYLGGIFTDLKLVYHGNNVLGIPYNAESVGYEKIFVTIVTEDGKRKDKVFRGQDKICLKIEGAHSVTLPDVDSD